MKSRNINTNWRGNLYKEDKTLTDSETNDSLNTKYPNKFKGAVISNGDNAVYMKITKDTWIKLVSESILSGINSVRIEVTEENMLSSVSITEDSLINKTVTSVIVNDNSKNTGYSVSGNTLTFTDETTIAIGNIITLNFEK